MKSNQHQHKLTPEQEKEFFDKLEVPYQKSKAQVWEAFENTIDSSNDQTSPKKSKAAKAKVVSIQQQRFYIGLAASLVLLLGFGLFARLYTTTIEVQAGEFTSHTLPDGSKVHLNAVSALSYQPYWWSFGRKVNLKGEAFFEVQKGKNFMVKSAQGTTEVLGTSFNIYTRDQAYQVYCATGKVRVSQTDAHVVLTPGQYAEVDQGQLKKRTKSINKTAILSWRLNKFMYNNTPLTKVLKDVERHYNVKIEVQLNNVQDFPYTGLFSRGVSVEEALRIICFSFELKVENPQSGQFIIKQK